MSDLEKIPTWLYHEYEEAKVFLLGEGEAPPEGWYDSPEKAGAAKTEVPQPVESLPKEIAPEQPVEQPAHIETEPE